MKKLFDTTRKPKNPEPLPFHAASEILLLTRDLCVNLLSFAHRDINHRDTKPSNIFLVRSGTDGVRKHNRIVDMGFAKYFEDDDSIDTQARTDSPEREANLSSINGEIVGSYPYMTHKSMTGTKEGRNDPYVNLLGVFAGILEVLQVAQRPNTSIVGPKQAYDDKLLGNYYDMKRLKDIIWPDHEQYQGDEDYEFPRNATYEDVAAELESEFREEFPDEAIRKLIYLAGKVVLISTMYSDERMPKEFLNDEDLAEGLVDQYTQVVKNITREVHDLVKEHWATTA